MGFCGEIDTSEILQVERQPLGSNNKGKSVLPFISYMHFVLYKVTQKVTLSDILKLLINVFNFIIQQHNLKTCIIRRCEL